MRKINQQKQINFNLACFKNTQGAFVGFKINASNYDDYADYNTKIIFWMLLAAKNQVTDYTFDDDGRLIKESYLANADATTPNKTVDYSYNKNGILLGYNDGITSAVYTVDKMSRLSTSETDYGSFKKSFNYTYHKDSKVASFTNAETIKTDYQYDKANRLRLIQIAGQGSIAVSEYQGYLAKKIIYPGGVNVINSYDGIGRVNMEDVKDPAGNVIQNTTYSYDKVGNIKSKNTFYGSFNYQYDKSYRLTSAEQPSPLSNRSYQYDAVGNRIATEIANESWNYNANHQLLSYGTSDNLTTFIYDDNGNTTSKTDKGGIEEYIYNVANRLSEVKRNGATIASYYYDPFGRRLNYWGQVFPCHTASKDPIYFPLNLKRLINQPFLLYIVSLFFECFTYQH